MGFIGSNALLRVEVAWQDEKYRIFFFLHIPASWFTSDPSASFVEFGPFWYHCCNSVENSNHQIPFMKSIKILAFAALLLAFGCGRNSKSTQDSKAAASEEVVYVGTLRSLRGVMHELSCHCFDGGILTQKNGDEINYCFVETASDADKNDWGKGDCKMVELKGTMVQNTITPAKGEVCPAGTMTYLKVKSARCLD